MNKQQEDLKDYPIDFVVLWVNGSDSKWLKKKKQYSAESKIADIKARYRDFNLFRYWFRGVEKYAPWVNHIYLVTDAQKPGWLKTNHPKLTIVDHKDIIDEKYLPTFNSQAIEMNLHKIPGLSEHFVYFNDDLFLVEKVKKSDFFKDGLPRGIANINAATGMEGDQLYAQTMFNNILLINRHYKKKDVVNRHLLKWINPKYGSFNLRTITQMPYPYFTGYKPFHMPSPLLKSTFNELWEKESEALILTCSHKFRHRDDLNQDIFTMWQLCKNEFIPKRKSNGKHIQLGSLSEVRIIKRALNNKRIKMLCINDSIDDDLPNSTVAQIGELLSELFEDKFPERSSYEK